MPIQHAIWKVGEAPVVLAISQLASEQQLEEMIVRDPRILTGYFLAGGFFWVVSSKRLDIYVA